MAGRSLVLRDPDLATLAAGWALGTIGGTPGAAPGAFYYAEFTLWRHTHFSPAELTNPAISGPAADPAGQGISNLVRYALGLTPQTNALAFLPTDSTNGAYFRFDFRRLKSAADLEYTVEASANLTAWTPLPETPVVLTDNGDGTETVRVETPTGANRKLVRLQVGTLP